MRHLSLARGLQAFNMRSLSPLLFLFAFCLQSYKRKKVIKRHDVFLRCLDSAVINNKTNRFANKANDIIRDLAVDDDKITDVVQTEYGESFIMMHWKQKLLYCCKTMQQLMHNFKRSMDELLAVRENPSSIKYAIYLLDDKQINAFTFGGRIYITKAMYDKCKGSTALLYSIIGHEIGHSEKGHIKKTIQEMMLADKVFGEKNGDFFFYIKKLLTGSLNQKRIGS